MRAESPRKKRDSGARALLKRRKVSIIVPVEEQRWSVQREGLGGTKGLVSSLARFSAAMVFPFRREYHLARSVTSHLPSTCELFLSVARLSLATASRLSPRSSGSHAPGNPRHVSDLRRAVSLRVDPHYACKFYDLLLKLRIAHRSAVNQRSYRSLAVEKGSSIGT